VSDSLREQLLKAGLVTEQQARQSAHNQRTDRKKQGREVVEAERQARREKVAAEQQAKREADRQREASRRTSAVDRETENRVRQIVTSGKLERTRGPRRFYFLTRDDRVPFVEIGDEVGARLERGQAAVAESPEGELTLIDGDSAKRVAELDPTWLRFWLGRAEKPAQG
jgi:uncharacterized protein YaiL (DUF2058 family)